MNFNSKWLNKGNINNILKLWCETYANVSNKQLYHQQPSTLTSVERLEQNNGWDGQQMWNR